MSESAPSTLIDDFQSGLRSLESTADNYVPRVVEYVLQSARQHRASDIHLNPVDGRLLMQWRIDGVLRTVAGFDEDLGARLTGRLKVLAGLLTYRTDLPQEGRVSTPIDSGQAGGEIRVTTFPSLFGERTAIRLFAEAHTLSYPEELGLPGDVLQSLQHHLSETSGVILLTGPSGSGKTTTAYACLREIVRTFGDAKGLMSLEDPIEVVLDGVSQSQVRDSVGFDLATGLRAMMRQDPDVLMVGEVRDPATAEGAFQAALTGHLVITTFHAGSCAEAVTRLLEMGLEPYLLRSTLRTVLCLRLLRRACDSCARPNIKRGGDSQADPENSGKPDHSKNKSRDGLSPTGGCAVCGGIGYHGRFVVAERLDPTEASVSQAILQRADARQLRSVAINAGMATLRQRADSAVSEGLTYPEEVFRVLGRS